MKLFTLFLSSIFLVGCDFDSFFKKEKPEINLICKGVERFSIENRSFETPSKVITYRLIQEKYSELVKKDGESDYKYEEKKGWVLYIDGKNLITPQNLYSNFGPSKYSGFATININENIIDIHKLTYNLPSSKDGQDQTGSESSLKISINRLSGEWTEDKQLITTKVGSKNSNTTRWLIKGTCEKSSMKI